MANRNWQGNTGKWNLGANWTGGAVPVSGDTASISNPLAGPYVVTYDTTSTIAGLSVGSANATLRWDTTAARSLTVSGSTTLSAGTIDLATTNQAGSKLTSGSLVVAGGQFLSDQTVSVTGAATFTGGTDTISGGTFSAGALTVGGTNTVLTLSGGTVTTTTVGGTSIAATDKIAMSGTAVLDASASGLIDSGTLSGAGTVKGTLAGGGAVTASGGTLDLTSNIAALSGMTFNVATAATSALQIDGTVGAGNKFSFLGSSGQIIENNAAAFTTTIAGSTSARPSRRPTSLTSRASPFRW